MGFEECNENILSYMILSYDDFEQQSSGYAIGTIVIRMTVCSNAYIIYIFAVLFEFKTETAVT